MNIDELEKGIKEIKSGIDKSSDIINSDYDIANAILDNFMQKDPKGYNKNTKEFMIAKISYINYLVNNVLREISSIKLVSTEIIEYINKLDTDECRKKNDDKMINSDDDIINMIVNINDEGNIDWVKNNNEFIGFTTLNAERFMLVLKTFLERTVDCVGTARTVYELTIYNLEENYMYKIKEDGSLYNKIYECHMYRKIESSSSNIINSFNNHINLEDQIKVDDAVKELEEMIKKEKEEKEIVLKHLLELIDELCYNSDCDSTFDTDGDQEEVFVRTTNDRLFAIDRHLLGYIIDILLTLLDYHAIKTDNTTYVYFIYNGNIFEVGRMVGQGTYEYLRRVIDINEDDEHIQLINLKKVYDKFYGRK